MVSTTSFFLQHGIRCPQGDVTWQAICVIQIVGKIHFPEWFLHHMSLQAKFKLSLEFHFLHNKQAGYWCCKSFLRFTYSGSCSDTARMRTWVPSTVPIIPGNWDANKKKKSWCLLIMSNVRERIWTFSQYKVVQGQWSPCELYSIIPKKSNNIMIQYHIPWIDKYPPKIQI